MFSRQLLTTLYPSSLSVLIHSFVIAAYLLKSSSNSDGIFEALLGVYSVEDKGIAKADPLILFNITDFELIFDDLGYQRTILF